MLRGLSGRQPAEAFANALLFIPLNSLGSGGTTLVDYDGRGLVNPPKPSSFSAMIQLGLRSAW